MKTLKTLVILSSLALAVNGHGARTVEAAWEIKTQDEALLAQSPVSLGV